MRTNVFEHLEAPAVRFITNCEDKGAFQINYNQFTENYHSRGRIQEHFQGTEKPADNHSN